MSSKTESLLLIMERAGVQFDWAEVENYARERQHPLTTAQRRERRLAAEDARRSHNARKKAEAARRALANIEAAEAKLS